MFFEDFAHGAVHGMHWASGPGGEELFFPENFDRDCRFGCAPRGFRRLKIHLIVDFAAQDAKGFQIVLSLADRRQFERRPRPVEPEEILFEVSRHRLLQRKLTCNFSKSATIIYLRLSEIENRQSRSIVPQRSSANFLPAFDVGMLGTGDRDDLGLTSFVKIETFQDAITLLSF